MNFDTLCSISELFRRLNDGSNKTALLLYLVEAVQAAQRHILVELLLQQDVSMIQNDGSKFATDKSSFAQASSAYNIARQTHQSQTVVTETVMCFGANFRLPLLAGVQRAESSSAICLQKTLVSN